MFTFKNPVVGLVIGTLALVGGTIVGTLGGGWMGENIGRLMTGR